MLKKGDRIAWRYKDSKIYTDGFIKEINGKMIRIVDCPPFGTTYWLNSEEIEIEILTGKYF